MNKTPVLVFDFDGTLVDSLDPIVDKVNLFAAKIGRKPFSEEQVERFLSSNSRNKFKKFPFTRWLMSLVTKAIEREQARNLSELEAVPRLQGVLEKLDKNRVRMGIVTSNSRVLVKRYMKLRHWDNFFSFVYGGGGIFQKSHLLQEMVTEEKFPLSQVIYIGDEPRDVEAAKAAGLRVAAVTWGFQPAGAFASLEPDWIIHKPEELLRLVNIKPWWQQLFS